MTMPAGSPPISPQRRSSLSWRLRFVMAGVLGAASALLVSCASSGGGLIPTGNAGPLQSDFAEVEQVARSGDGSCNATEAAIAKTEQDFSALPVTVDQGLRTRLREGIAALRTDALKLCVQPFPQTTATGTSTRTATGTTTAATTPTTTHTTTTESTPTTNAPTTSGPGGGTPAPPSEAPSGAGQGGASPGEDKGSGEGKGLGEGKGGPGGSEGAGADGGQEGGK
jgi:hypothetical protein